MRPEVRLFHIFLELLTNNGTPLLLKLTSMCLVLYSSISSLAPWTLFARVLLEVSSAPTTLFLDSPVLVTTGLKAVSFFLGLCKKYPTRVLTTLLGLQITPKVPSL